MAEQPHRRGGHFRNMALTAGGTMGSRVLGLVRDQLVAGFFGTSTVASAVILAFQIPNLFRRLLGEGALTAALMPVMSQERQRGGNEQAFVFLNLVMRRIAPLLLAISVVLIGVSWWLGTHWPVFESTMGGLYVRWVGIVDAIGCVRAAESVSAAWQSFVALFGSPESAVAATKTVAKVSEGGGSDYAMAARLTAICMPYMPMICLAALFTAALNMLGRFALTSLTAVWLNVAMIVGLGLFGWLFGHTPEQQAVWLCVGSLVGGVLQLAIPAWGLRRLGWSPRMKTPESSPEAWNDLKIIFLPAVVGAGVQQFNVFVTRFMAFSVSENALSAYYFANRVVELPVGVFAVTVSSVIFPALAAHAAIGDRRAFAGDFAHGLRLIFAINMAACAGLVALAEPIVRTLFQHHNFTAEDTALTVPVLIIFSLTLPFYGLVGLSSRALSARKDTRTQMRFAIRDLILNAILAPVLGYWFKAPGLAAANLIAVIYQAVTLLRVVRASDEHIASENIFRPLLQTFTAAAIMGLFARGSWMVIGHFVSSPKIGALTGLCLIIPASVILYFALLRAMHYPEAAELLAVAKRKLRIR